MPHEAQNLRNHRFGRVALTPAGGRTELPWPVAARADRGADLGDAVDRDGAGGHPDPVINVRGPAIGDTIRIANDVPDPDLHRDGLDRGYGDVDGDPAAHNPFTARYLNADLRRDRDECAGRHAGPRNGHDRRRPRDRTSESEPLNDVRHRV